MSKLDLEGIADRLFREFLAPLVLGGDMTVGKPIGSRAALAVGEARGSSVADPDLYGHVELARIRVARLLVPVDRAAPPSPGEWALAAALHDLVQTTHPSLPGVFRKAAPARLLALVDATVDEVRPPSTVRDALDRHTWFSRVFEIARTDTVLSWWTGSRTFLGTTPPPRLAAWPELRRVHVDKSSRALVDLPTSGGGVEPMLFERSLARWLARTPLTDLATCHRATPIFAWTAETLGIVATRGGCTIAQRAMARAPVDAVDRALGRATRHLVVAKAWQPAMIALDLLGDRALAAAEALVARGGKSSAATRESAPTDAGFARAAGAIVAQRRLLVSPHELPDDERARILGVLEPAAVSPAAGEVKAMLG